MPIAAIADFCRRWKIRELALFGSVLRDDFGPDSDIDVLVTFQPDARWGLFKFAGMQLELSEILDRNVDFVSRKAIELSRNEGRRQRILSSAHTIYAA